ncbi:MAG: hypothetical protein OWR52_01490 [Acidibacillus sp.]|nr:hypothetical protein [Acidibacillus sp.]
MDEQDAQKKWEHTHRARVHGASSERAFAQHHMHVPYEQRPNIHITRARQSRLRHAGRRKLTVQKVWRTSGLAILFLIALILTLLIRGYATHPGVHLAGVAVVLDLVIWKTRRNLARHLIGWVAIIIANGSALAVINWGNDPTELWTTSVLGLLSILLLLLPQQKHHK